MKRTSPTDHLTWDQVRGFRQHRQGLTQRVPPAQALDVARALGGAHAQLLTSAGLTLWARVDGLDQEWLDRALWEDRILVKTWAMRGTLHTLAADELALWCAALSTIKPRHHAASWERYFGVSRADYERILAVIPDALDGPPLTREQLADEVGRRTSAALSDRLRESWGSLLKPAAFQGLICFAPNAGQNVRFTRPDRWLPEWSMPDHAGAAQEATRRYLAAYGPASREEFARWFGTTPAHAGRLIAALDDEVALVDVEGSAGWMLAGDVKEAQETTAGGAVRLLPAFDQYVVAAPRRGTPILPDAHADRVYRPQGWLSPVVLVGGRVAGVWRHEMRGNRVEVEIDPFTTLAPGDTRAAEDEAARLAAYLGRDLTLRCP